MMQKLKKIVSIIKGHDLEEWVNASVQRWDTSGISGSTPWAFDYHLAMSQCQSWVYRAAVGNSQKAASVPLRLYVKKSGGGSGKSVVWNSKSVSRATIKRLQRNGASSAVRHKAVEMDDDMVELTEHPVLKMLSAAPNQWTNGYEMLTWVFLCLELAGNAYLYPQIDSRTGVPSGLYPMLPQWMLIKPGKEGSDQLIEGYAYGNFSARERVTDFTADEVMHCKYPSVKNMFYGQGKVEAAWEVLGLQTSQRRAFRALFDNGLNPGMLVASESIQSDAQARDIEGRMNTIFRGVRNAGKLMVMTGKASVTPLAVNPKDISTQENTLEEICAVFGYPISMILANDAGKANADASERAWLRHTIQPMLSTVEQWLNHSLLPLFGEEVAANACLAFDSPWDEDQSALEASAVSLTSGGVITVNEGRQMLQMQPIEDGDTLRFNGMPYGMQGIGYQPDPFGEKGCSGTQKFIYP